MRVFAKRKPAGISSSGLIYNCAKYFSVACWKSLFSEILRDLFDSTENSGVSGEQSSTLNTIQAGDISRDHARVAGTFLRE